MRGSAQRRLIDLYADRAAGSLRLAFLMTGDRDAAEDIVQEAFVRMFARLEDRRAPEHLDAYLRRIIINLSHDRHRRLRSARRFLERGGDGSTGPTETDMDSRVAFRDLLQGLPHRQRAALVLRYHEDLSEHDAATILDCSVSALKQLIQRGLSALRRQQGDDHA